MNTRSVLANTAKEELAIGALQTVGPLVALLAIEYVAGKSPFAIEPLTSRLLLMVGR